jgi:hypothetical protein
VKELVIGLGGLLSIKLISMCDAELGEKYKTKHTGDSERKKATLKN